MDKRFFLQLLNSEKKGKVQRQGALYVLLAWLTLNACLWFVSKPFSPLLTAIVNVWFFVVLVLTYHYGRLRQAVALKQVRSTELWAREYLKDPEAHRHDLPFEVGTWVVTDALLSMENGLSSRIDQSFQVDQFVRAKTFLDSETGVGNRVYFDNRLDAFLADRDNHSGGCLLLIQLRELAEIQQHSVSAPGVAATDVNEGQEVLNHFIALVGHFLTSQPDAVFARRSNDDFALLIPSVSFAETEKLASRLMRLFQRIDIPDTVDRDHFFHIGAAMCKIDESPYQLLAEADMALRAAQLQGPNNWFMYDQKEIGKDFAKGSVRWRTAIESAIAHQAFVLLFQPVILTDNGEIHHHEILARMRMDNGQLASASVFLPMAQECGLVAKIDQLIVEKIVKLLQYDRRSQDICSLNLHIDSLLNQPFQQWLIEFLQRFPAVACRLVIEISEYPLVHQGQSLRYFLRQLHKIGCRLLVDNVGLYVLNTQYIREYEIDYLKLHVSIVKAIDQRAENQLFVKSLQGTCSGTHVLIFGLGVEQVAEWIALQKLGLAGAQGHYFTEPLSAINQISPSH